MHSQKLAYFFAHLFTDFPKNLPTTVAVDFSKQLSAAFIYKTSVTTTSKDAASRRCEHLLTTLTFSYPLHPVTSRFLHHRPSVAALSLSTHAQTATPILRSSSVQIVNAGSRRMRAQLKAVAHEASPALPVNELSVTFCRAGLALACRGKKNSGDKN